jgi:hypothetical protein
MSGSVLPNQGRISESLPCYIPYADKNYFASTFTFNTGVGGIGFYAISTPQLRINTNTTPTIMLTPAQNGSLVQPCYVSSMGNLLTDGYIRIAPTNSSNFLSGQQCAYKYTILNQ